MKTLKKSGNFSGNSDSDNDEEEQAMPSINIPDEQEQATPNLNIPNEQEQAKPPEATRHHNSTKLLILLPLRANSKSTFQYETPCT